MNQYRLLDKEQKQTNMNSNNATNNNNIYFTSQNKNINNPELSAVLPRINRQEKGKEKGKEKEKEKGKEKEKEKENDKENENIRKMLRVKDIKEKMPWTQ